MAVDGDAQPNIEQLKLEAERLRLKAERMRLEGEKAGLKLEREKLEAFRAKMATEKKPIPSYSAMDATTGTTGVQQENFRAAESDISAARSVRAALRKLCFDKGLTSEWQNTTISYFVKFVENATQSTDNAAKGPLGVVLSMGRNVLMEFVQDVPEKEGQNGTVSAAAAVATARRGKMSDSATLTSFLQAAWDAPPDSNAGSMVLVSAFGTFLDECIKEGKTRDAEAWAERGEIDVGTLAFASLAAAFLEVTQKSLNIFDTDDDDLDQAALSEFIDRLDAVGIRYDAAEEEEEAESDGDGKAAGETLAAALDDATLKRLREEVLGPKVFDVTNVAKSPLGSACLLRGNPAGKDLGAMLAEAERRLAAAGLAGKVTLFLQEDAARTAVEEQQTDEMDIALAFEEEGLGMLTAVRYVCFIAVSGDARLQGQWGGALADAAFNFAGTFAAWSFALGTYAFNSGFADRLLTDGDMSALQEAVPLFLMVLGAQAAHEASHAAAGASRGLGMQTPRLFASPTLGLFGSKAKPAARPADYAASFDFHIAGPLGGAAVSAAMFYAGLLATAAAPAEAGATFPQMPSILLQGSTIAGGLTDVVLSTHLAEPDVASAMVPLHPMAVAGFGGLVANALQLVPWGTTDGSNAFRAAGAWSRFLSFPALLWVFFQAWFGKSELLSFWPVALLLLYNGQTVAVKNELSNIDWTRLVVLFGAAVFSVAMLSPLPLHDFLPPGGTV